MDRTWQYWAIHTVRTVWEHEHQWKPKISFKTKQSILHTEDRKVKQVENFISYCKSANKGLFVSGNALLSLLFALSKVFFFALRFPSNAKTFRIILEAQWKASCNKMMIRHLIQFSRQCQKEVSFDHEISQLKPRWVY